MLDCAHESTSRDTSLLPGDLVWARLSAEILVVEGDCRAATELEQALAVLGYTDTAYVATGELALESASRRCFDLVLIGSRLGGALGALETAERLRAHSLAPVLYVGGADPDAFACSGRLALCGSVLRPLRSRQLRGAVEAALSLGGYRREIADTLVPPPPAE
jgi:DNA-binding response OmpR family regulator